MDSTYIFIKTKYHKATVFHSRLQTDSFFVKNRDLSLEKKKAEKKPHQKKSPNQEKYINFHLTAIHLMKHFFFLIVYSDNVFLRIHFCIFKKTVIRVQS